MTTSFLAIFQDSEGEVRFNIIASLTLIWWEFVEWINFTQEIDQ
jgi:hypothetical protein